MINSVRVVIVVEASAAVGIRYLEARSVIQVGAVATREF